MDSVHSSAVREVSLSERDTYGTEGVIGLGRRLVLNGLLTAEQAKEAYQKAFEEDLSFVAYVVSKKILSAIDLARFAAEDFGVPLLDLNAFDLELLPRGLASEALIQQHHVLPLFRRGNRLYIAESDPTNLQALDDIKFQTGLNTHTILVEEDKLSRYIKKYLEGQQHNVLGEMHEEDDDGSFVNEVAFKGDNDEEDYREDAPVVRFVHKLLLDAIHKRASDIHFEPYEKNYRIRFRIDGVLYEVAAPPYSYASRIAARLKILSRLDISERRVPQDGRFKMMISKKRGIDFRVSTCPTLNGEKVVMRILDSASTTQEINTLGFEPKQRALFEEAIHHPQGMILVTGPTGSGKTVTLYSALNALNSTEENISTVEDPVEIHVQGINQVHVNTKAGLDFSTVLRAFLRQDPDIIMVGEIRDLETAEIAIKAAQTGHLVLSTLHTNSAPETLTRMENMGLLPFNIATSVTLIIAQRLARRLCTKCKTPVNYPKEALLKEGFREDELEQLTLYEAANCDECVNGYKGRVGIFEVMPISEEIGRLIMAGATTIEIAAQAVREGMQTLRRSGLNRVREGTTSLEELDRVTKD